MRPPEPPQDPLDQLLSRWHGPEANPRLKAEVWRRISSLEEGAGEVGWFGWTEWFTRPSVAVLFVACCVFLGLFLAEIRVSRMERERSVQLARGYLQLVDPLLKEEPGLRR